LSRLVVDALYLSILIPSSFLFFFLLLRPPPTSTLFPYTTLFRSDKRPPLLLPRALPGRASRDPLLRPRGFQRRGPTLRDHGPPPDRKSTRLNSSHRTISYAVFCLKKKKKKKYIINKTPTHPHNLP